jgi:tRNA 5-methylaminomethyl-2-thiouridine biosynthesis bifunctional protein
MYDVAIIGAGINGTSVAYEFLKANKSVIIFDMDKIAGGGSGAAGAFIAPKFSKSGELKELLHDAFVYSMEFYEKNFKNIFKKTTLIHIANDETSSDILKHYKKHTALKLKEIPKDFMNTLQDEAKAFEAISLDAGIVDAQSMCKALSNGAKYVQKKVDALIYDDGVWVIDECYSAKNIILSTGAYESIIKEPYIKLRGVWGHRIDIKTSSKNPYSIHQNVSISPSSNSILAIGATHNVHYHPQTSTTPYNVDAGRVELLQKASKTIKLEDVEVLKDYTGLRSGSFDYMPMVGSLVISKETLQDKTIRFKTKKPQYERFTYYPNLYMINGNGGYGFVLAPYLAKILKEHILEGKTISHRLSPDRFFARYAKKL